MLQLPLFIVCPKTVKAIWKNVAKKFGLTIVQTITFQSMSSKLRKQPNHGYLHKTWRVDKKERDHYYFSPTTKFLDLVKTGVLFIVDEIQFIRNNTAQYRSIRTLTNAIAKTPKENASKFALLSASPFDKPVQAINLMKLIGIIQQPELNIRSRPTGWLELVQYVKKVNLGRARTLLTGDGGKRLGPRQYKDKAFNIYVEIVRPSICSAMPLVIHVPCDAKNGFYTITPELESNFEKGLKDLEDAASKTMDPTVSRVTGDCNYADLTKAMVYIESLKYDIFERIAKQELMGDSTCKVVIGVHYLKTLYELEYRLAEYNPLVLSGSVEEDEREDIIDLFQNNPRERLLLCIARVGGIGISLHDVVGDAPRKAFLSPTFNLIEQYQFVGRFYRVGTKSPVKVRIVYGNAGNKEKKIQECLASKSKTLKSTLEEYAREGIVLPNDYEDEIEK
jgi:hypothetical protein